MSWRRCSRRSSSTEDRRRAPGDTFPTHSSALGKSTLSLLGDEALDKAIGKLKLSQLTEATITDAKAFKKDILAGRQRGYFLTRGETVADVMGISIALRIGGEPYAIGVAGPTSRLKENLETYLAAVKEAEVAPQTSEEYRNLENYGMSGRSPSRFGGDDPMWFD